MKTKFKSIDELVEHLQDHPEVTDGIVSVKTDGAETGGTGGWEMVSIAEFRKDMGGEVDKD